MIFRCILPNFQPAASLISYSKSKLFAFLSLTTHFSFAFSVALSRDLTHLPWLLSSSASISSEGEVRDFFRSGLDARTPCLFGLFA